MHCAVVKLRSHQVRRHLVSVRGSSSMASGEPNAAADAAPPLQIACAAVSRRASPFLRLPAAAPLLRPALAPPGCPGCGRASPHRRRAVGGRQRRHRRGHGPGARPGQKQRSAPPFLALSVPMTSGAHGSEVKGGVIYFCYFG